MKTSKNIRQKVTSESSDSVHRIKPYLLLLSSCVLLGLPFAIESTSWLIYFSLVPLLFYLEKPFKKYRITPLWLMGFVFFLTIFLWIPTIKTESWSQVHGLPVVALVFVIWVTCAAIMSLGFVALAKTFSILDYRHHSAARKLTLFTSSWVLMEYLRSWLFSMYAWGVGASLGANWNFGTLGFAAASTPIVGASRIVGLYGLTAIVVIINFTIYMALSNKSVKRLLPLIGITALVFLGSYAWNPGSKKISTTIVRLDEADTNYHTRLAQLAVDKGVKQAELLVLPEYSHFFNTGEADQSISALRTLLAPHGVVIDSESTSRANKPPYNTLMYRNAEGTIISAQNKTFLIPAGEYLPALLAVPMQLIGGKKLTDDFIASTSVSRGSESESIVQYGNLRLGALACSGAIAPEHYRIFAKQNADILVNSAALNIFNDAAYYKTQSRQMARFIAVANNRPFVQSARGGFSFIYDSRGHLQTIDREVAMAIKHVQIRAGGTRTIYSFIGEWVVVLAALAMAGIAKASYKKTRLH